MFGRPLPTFGQNLGAEPLPSQMDHTTVTTELRSYAWAMIRLEMTCVSRVNPDQLYAHWRNAFIEWFIRRDFNAADEFPKRYIDQHNYIKAIIWKSDYIRFFNFFQFLIEQPALYNDLKKKVALMLVETHAAYRVIDNRIIPVTSEENAQAITQAFTVARGHGAQGPVHHLRAASIELSNGAWASAIRESINAVEAAAKAIEPDANELGPALSKLEKRQAINPAMKKAFGALYGFSSDEKGIRHSLVYDDQANVSEADAMFMFGACAAFVSYLLSQP